MGTLLKAKCKCGFERDEILDGSGWNGPGEDPAVCLRCNKFFVYRCDDGERFCQYCGHLVKWYLHTNSKELMGETVTYESEEEYYKKPAVVYYCPECGERELGFFAVGNWD